MPTLQGTSDVVAGEDAAHRVAGAGEGDVHQHQAKQEVGDRQAAEAQEGEWIVTNRVPADGRAASYADGCRERDTGPPLPAVPVGSRQGSRGGVRRTYGLEDSMPLSQANISAAWTTSGAG